jgi:hypothetical protein
MYELNGSDFLKEILLPVIVIVLVIGGIVAGLVYLFDPPLTSAEKRMLVRCNKEPAYYQQHHDECVDVLVKGMDKMRDSSTTMQPIIITK